MSERAETMTDSWAELAGFTMFPCWLRVGEVFTGYTGEVLRNAHVVFDEKSIRYVGPAEVSPPPAVLRSGQAEPDFEFPDQTLLPGLIEAHAHLFLEGAELDFEKRKAYLAKAPDALLTDAEVRMRLLVDLGIAAVRDAGDRRGVGLALARDRRTGGGGRRPFLDSPGAGFHHAGRYGAFMGETVESFPNPQAAVEARRRAGAERIKLIPTGIINFAKGAVTAKPQMSAAEVRAFCEAAQLCGLPTFAHASGAEGIQHALDGGVNSVEHGFFVTDDQLCQMRDRGIAWVPTFAPVQRQIDEASRMGWDATVQGHLQRILDGHARALNRAVELGVRIVAGSDAGSCGVAHGCGFLYELELMERAGMSAERVLAAATGESAEALKFAEPLGCIKEGARSRMLLMRQSPLRSVVALREAKLVIFDGDHRVVSAAKETALL